MKFYIFTTIEESSAPSVANTAMRGRTKRVPSRQSVIPAAMLGNLPRKAESIFLYTGVTMNESIAAQIREVIMGCVTCQASSAKIAKKNKNEPLYFEC